MSTPADTLNQMVNRMQKGMSTRDMMVMLIKAEYNQPNLSDHNLGLVDITIQDKRAADISKGLRSSPTLGSEADRIKVELNKLKAFNSPEFNSFNQESEPHLKKAAALLQEYEELKSRYAEALNAQKQFAKTALGRIGQAPNPEEMARSQDINNELINRKKALKELEFKLKRVTSDASLTLNNLSTLSSQVKTSVDKAEQKAAQQTLKR